MTKLEPEQTRLEFHVGAPIPCAEDGIGQNDAGWGTVGCRPFDLIERDAGLVWKSMASGTPALARRVGSLTQSFVK